ncbi:hypothetical protein Vretimale_10660 [Volvox reticuliferus]|uniref:Peptidase S54 rhomboid domain-containing protein n=1 Tax=Volvox reticuliferus TaxID=1737510 RepID=A0A8J4LQY0_9CHLO|nr:hypothetical protein Vretifemale_13935 [Volvox reticuliferus]GIM06328.1 hypothetical protein Vretimale_10660 [Volvox reticuliferus]
MWRTYSSPLPHRFGLSTLPHSIHMHCAAQSFYLPHIRFTRMIVPPAAPLTAPSIFIPANLPFFSSSIPAFVLVDPIVSLRSDAQSPAHQSHSGLVRGAMYHGAMGFSGIIFGLVVWESALSPVPFRSIFGLFQVPIAWYPWALLLFCQLLVPEASFVGHLAGLMVGQLWVWGLLRPLALSRSATTWLEQAGLMARCVRQPSFIMMPSSALPYTMFDVRGAGGGGTSGGGSLGGQGSGGVRLGGLGRNLVSLGKMFRSGSSGAAGASDGGGNGRDVEAVGGSQDRGAFAGTGRVLGGNGGSGGVAAAPPLPSVAAALAAEARIGGGGGGVAGGIPGSGVGGGIGTGGATAARDKALNS